MNVKIECTYAVPMIRTYTEAKSELPINSPICMIGKYTYGASMMICTHYKGEGKFIHNLQIGNCCSIASGCNFAINANHDYRKVYMGFISVTENKKKSVSKKQGEIIIQNDVWIGYNVTILSGVTIHNGAVVAAGAVVTKDVMPYSIVGGVPAKHIKYRFEQEIIDKLQKIQWWYWEEEVKENRLVAFEQEIEGFVETFYEEAVVNDRKIELMELDINVKKESYLFFMDLKDELNTFEDVLMGFVEKFKGELDVELIIYCSEEEYDENEIVELNSIRTLVESLLEKMEAKCSVQFYLGKEQEEVAIFKYAKYYISTRNEKNVFYSCMADKYGLKKISCVDSPIF